MKKLYLTEGGYDGPITESVKGLNYFNAISYLADEKIHYFPFLSVKNRKGIHDLWEESIFEAWKSARKLLNLDSNTFKFEEFDYHCKKFTATFNNKKNGYDVIFNEDCFYHLDKYALHIFLGVDEKGYSVSLCKDDESKKMTGEQQSLIDNFISQVNQLKENYAK